MKCDITQITRSNKRKEGEPKGTIDISKELRDRLRAKSSITYGDGGFIVGYIPKGARMFSSETIQEGSGTRPTKLPKKFTKLIDICGRHKEEFKAGEIYPLMFNMNMYEIAYNKLKSNPVGRDQVTLDGISRETFQKIIESMKDETFQFKPGRRDTKGQR